MENGKYSRQDAIGLLRSAAAKLSAQAHLGPWPRALEAAGLKPPRSFDRIERNREKRRAAKRRRRECGADGNTDK